MRRFAFGIVASLLWLVPASASPASSLTEAIETKAGGDALRSRGLETLARSGAEFEQLLVAERLPASDATTYLVEAAFAWRGGRFRYPLVLRHAPDAGWRITWAPVRAYTRDLLRLLKNGSLPTVPADAGTEGDESDDGWLGLERVPAFPVVVTSERLTTPFGRLSFRKTGGLAAPKGFKRHVGRWVRQVSASDEAGAAIDVLAARNVPWRRLTQILLGTASFGYVRAHLIGTSREGGGRPVLSHLAPVSFDRKGRDAPPALVIGLYGIAPTYRFRVVLGGELLTGEHACSPDSSDSPEMSLCLSTLEGFAPSFRALMTSRSGEDPPRISRVMFASTGDLSLERVVPVLVRLPGALQISARQLMLGHIRARTRRPTSP